MNHSINNLLWITLFAVLYISSVIAGGSNCGDTNHADSCSDCTSSGTCEALSNKGPYGCGCGWDGTPGCGPCARCGCCYPACDPPETEDPTIDPTIDPTSDPTVDPTIDPTIDPTQIPTAPTNHPSITPTSNPSMTPTSNPSITPTSNPSITPTSNPSITPTSNPSITPTNIPSITPTLAPTGDGDGDDDDDDDDDDDSSSEDVVTAALFEENKLGDNAVGSNNDGTTTSINSLHFSNQILMNIWILFSVLMIVNIIFCFMCRRNKRGVAKIVEESSTMDNIHI